MTDSKASLKQQGYLGSALALVGVILSAMLVCKHMFPDLCSSSLGCTVEGGVDGCRELGQSRNSRLLNIPIPIAAYGLFYYSFVLALFWKLGGADAERRNGLVNIALATVLFGLVVDVALAYKNFFVLLYPCRLCSYTYLVQLGLAGAAGWVYLANNRELGSGEDLKAGIKGSILPVATAVIITVATVLVLTIAASRGNSGGHSHDDGHGHSHGPTGEAPPLLPAARVKEVLSELRALKKGGISTAGLTQIEGEKGAYIEIQEFADFNCPHCMHASVLMQEALKRWPGRVKVVFRHFPLDGTCNEAVGQRRGGSSCLGAQAALCAASQGIFPQVYHGIFGLQNAHKGISPTTLQEIVEKSGGNWARVQACMGSGETAAQLKRDIRDAIKIEVESTPTVLLQDHKFPPGVPDATYLMQALDALVFEKEGQKAYDWYASQQKK